MGYDSVGDVRVVGGVADITCVVLTDVAGIDIEVYDVADSGVGVDDLHVIVADVGDAAPAVADG